ncbi:MAG: hypothetical protein FVQ79_00135 [Planctomycetes bacterium]|nr:hypothetical protein [Planctomycetota bacterium]
MPSYIQRYHLRGQFIARCERPYILVQGEEAQPTGTIYVCPICGEAWGKILIEGCQFMPVRRACPDHGAAYLMKYSDLIDYDEGRLEIPTAVLAHEITMMSRWSESDYDIALITGGKECLT